MMKVKCKRCGYEWETHSEMVLVSCPSCNNKVKIREIENED
jgi:DNA-directed RNA polymerase subunit RPC12/RpoP